MGSLRLSGSNVREKSLESTGADAYRVASLGCGQIAKVRAGEDVGLCKGAGHLGLVPPHESLAETALSAKDLLKGPEEIAVPDQEQGVVVHSGHHHLMKLHQILVSAPRSREPARGLLLHQALDATDKRQTARGRVGLPFEAVVQVPRAGGCGCGQLSRGRRK